MVLYFCFVLPARVEIPISNYSTAPDPIQVLANVSFHARPSLTPSVDASTTCFFFDREGRQPSHSRIAHVHRQQRPTSVQIFCSYIASVPCRTTRILWTTDQNLLCVRAISILELIVECPCGQWPAGMCSLWTTLPVSGVGVQGNQTHLTHYRTGCPS